MDQLKKKRKCACVEIIVLPVHS